MQTNEQVPPRSNRGVQNTHQPPLRSLIDWVQVTLRTVEDVHEAFEVLNVEKCKFIEMEQGLYGYKRHLKFGHISVLYEGGLNAGIHIQMSGQGCREYEAYNDWNTFILKCFEKNANFTRLDIAVDEIRYNDDKPYFKVSTLVRKTEDNCVSSRFHSARHIRTIKITGGESAGHTVYFGSPASDLQIRFYEKDKERLAASKELEVNLTTWNRTEIQSRNERANAIALYLLNSYDLGYIVKGVLSNYINFLIKGNCQNKARWKKCEWWTSFLNDTEKLKLTLIASDKTIEKTISWIDKQVSTSLAMLVLAYGSDDFLKDLIIDATSKLTDFQVELAMSYRENKLEENKYINYLKKNKYDRYLFLTGQHHLGIKKDTIE